MFQRVSSSKESSLALTQGTILLVGLLGQGFAFLHVHVAYQDIILFHLCGQLSVIKGNFKEFADPCITMGHNVL
jgi:hypothetical protein